jgi:hypothetical protein
MGRVIFDMGSTDNFSNPYNTWWSIEDRNKAKEFPPWLTLPVHYREKKPIWSQVFQIMDEGSYHNGNISVVKLTCGHLAHINSIYLRNAISRANSRIFVSCMECGGNGATATEIRG